MSQIHNKIKIKQGRSPVHLITDYWILMTPLILSGCMGVYEGGFECPPGEGLGCTSISDVNEKVNQGLGSRNQNSNQEEGDLNESENTASSCKSGSCSKPSPSSEIWYSPWFINSQDLVSPTQSSDTKVFHVRDSI